MEESAAERESSKKLVQINRLACLQTHWWPRWINSDDHTNKKRKKNLNRTRIYSSAIHRRYFEKHWTTWCFHTPPKIRYSSNKYILKPNFRIRTQHGQIWIENPPVTCFRVPMSASTFSYKYNKPSIPQTPEYIERAFQLYRNNNRINIYGLLENSIVYIIVCLFSLAYGICKKNFFGYFQQDILQINPDVYSTTYPPASNVNLSLASPAEYSSPLRLSIINYNIFFYF